MTARCLPMTRIARNTSTILAAPVVDQSGLDGFWTYEISVVRPDSDEPMIAFLAKAFQEQLGLVFQTTTGAIPMLIVRSVEPLRTD